jgi:hypothetical protein
MASCSLLPGLLLASWGDAAGFFKLASFPRGLLKIAGKPEESREISNQLKAPPRAAPFFIHVQLCTHPFQ